MSRTAPAWALLPLLTLASGAYAALPGAGYLVALWVAMALWASPAWRATPGRYSPPAMLAGALLFNVVFLVDGLWASLDARMYVLHAYALLMFVMAHACVSVAYGASAAAAERMRLAVAIAGLALLLAGQLLQAAGWLGFAPPTAGNFLTALVFRPGGFLNANVTAAVALILLYQAGLHRASRLRWPAVVALCLVAAVIALTQSRAGLLAFGLYGAWILRRHPLPLAGVGALVAVTAWHLGLFEQGGLLGDVLVRFVDRFAGDASSDERAWILQQSAGEFERAPWMGAGYLALERLYGLGSHSMPVELFVSFGALGALPMLVAAALMLWPASSLYFAVCVLPSFLFSHSYFDSAPLQAALGIALASERLWRRQVVAVGPQAPQNRAAAPSAALHGPH